MKKTLLRVLAVAGIQFAGGAIGGRPSDPQYYRDLRQAPFAPPSWVFAPAWALAKTGSSIALVRIWDSAPSRERTAYIALATVDAAIYMSFTYVYFRRRSIGLAAVWTTADALATAGQLALASKLDRKAAVSLLPQAAWLALATPAAIYQAANN